MTELPSTTPTENTPTATAWDGPRLVGLARALEDGELVAYLHYVLVDPAYQGQGIASGLIAQMKERFRNYLYLEVMPQGEQERPPSTSVRASPSCKTASRCRSATSRTSAWPAWRLSRTA